jgi:hypothetical protein
MSTLLTEAERRYLAAVLDEPDLALDQIQANDFAHPGYARVYQAVNDIHREQNDLDGPELTRAVAEQAGAPGLDADRLELLRAEAPDTEQLPFYVGMILDASAQRELATIAANQDHVEQYQKLFNTPWPDQAVAAIAPEAATRSGHEELLVASLMAYPEQAKTLVGIVPPETVQDFRCRVAYEVVASAAWDGDYTSDVSLVWQIAKAQEIAKALGDTPPSYTEPDAAFVARLSRTEITDQTGLDTARQLLAQDLRHNVSAAPGPELEPQIRISPASIFANPGQIDPHAPPTPTPEPGIAPQHGRAEGTR